MYQVLLVDDEPILQMGIRKMLEHSRDYEICASARNGAEALQYLQHNCADIIMTDLKMPVMDGVTLIKNLQQQKHPSPIIVLSNYSDFVLVREALTSGAMDYVLKLDLTESTLLAHLDKLVEHIKSRKSSQASDSGQEREALLCSQLRSFFREPQAAESVEPDLPENLQPPFLAFTVYFPKGSIKSDRLRRVLPHVETVLRTAFEGAHILPLLLHHNELLCLVGTVNEELAISDSLRLLQRQLSTYFSVTPILSYCGKLESLRSAKNAYERCREAYGISFYDSEKTLFCVNAVHIAQEIPPERVSTLVGNILDAFHAGNLEQARGAAHEEFLHWQQYCLAPDRARITCLRVLDSVRYAIEADTIPEAYEAQQKDIENAPTMEVMEEHFGTAIQLLAECKLYAFETHKREVQAVLRYLYTHYSENITLESLAETTCLNRSYLCRTFKKEMGMSIFNYLNTIRMKHAKELLLKDGDLYIKEIAIQVGITDPFYFTRRFKEYYGVSPKEYLDKNKSL